MALKNPFSKEQEAQKDDKPSYLDKLNKKSAARAKPARAAATSVRVSSGSSSSSHKKELTKEERKEQRRLDNAAADRESGVTNVLLNHDPSYLELRRRWWIMIFTGLICTAISWILMTQATQHEDISDILNVISVIALIAAYAGIIGGFIFDMRRIRPIRTATASKVHGMTEKRQNEILAKYQEERQEREEQRKKKKAAKKSK